MEAIQFILNEVVLLTGLYGLLAIFMCYIISLVLKSFKTVLRGRYYGSMFGLMFCSIMVGGTKTPIPEVLISWDEGLYDAGSEVDTNDLNRITFRWRYDPWIPPISTVTVSALPIGSSNSFEVASASITNFELTASMETEATNYAYLVTHSYTPDPAVKTNGVYHIDCFDTTNRTWVPKGVVVMKDGRPVSYETNAVPPTLGSGGVESVIYILEEME